MSETSRRTSFFSLAGSDQPEGGLAIRRIEIPHFQRDYAQGRDTRTVAKIRTDFLDVLHDALAIDGSASVGLDFVYGGVREGTLQPLDGQQRLTTLFLLHWYLASRCRHVPRERGWTRFSYATRQSAWMFCESLVGDPLPAEAGTPSSWIEDQPWFQFLWRHDPTIQSMLVMLDAIHDRFRDVDVTAAFERLTDSEEPAIWFLLLPLSALGSAEDEGMRPEDLYIKMNSRGKPLTEFESFKAQFEKTIQWSPRAADFALKTDTEWSDLFWGLRGDNDLIDDEFLRYLEFITEVCEWRGGRSDGAGQDLNARARAVFGVENPQRAAHLDFLFEALEIWADRSISGTFESLFVTGLAPDDPSSAVRLFFRSEGEDQETMNLFEACCRTYGDTRGRRGDRVFSAGQTLMLYALLLHLIDGTQEFPRRVRVLRNLIESSTNELRFDRMPEILEDVDQVIRSGDVAAISVLNQAQVEDETVKGTFLEEHSELEVPVFRLEDHELLRGSLGAFEHEPGKFARRATEFQRLMSTPDLWPDLLGALLAVGEYQRQPGNAKRFRFGTSSKKHMTAWRLLLTGPKRDSLQPTRGVLMALLDRIASGPAEMEQVMQSITDNYLGRCEDERRFDWRYYMVRYPAMREEGSSTYVAEPEPTSGRVEMGYSLCMLAAGGVSTRGYYRDPYLLAISQQLDDPDVVMDKKFMGPETEPRRLPLAKSGASIRCVWSGFELSPPADLYREEFATACDALGVGSDMLVAVSQVEIDGRRIDTVDRIQTGANLIRELVAAGL